MTARIDSPADPRLDPYQHVGDAGWLRRQGLFVAEGRLVLLRLLAQARMPIQSILVTPAACEALAAPLAAADAPVYVCDQRVMNEVTGYNFHRGCLALAARPAPASADALLDSALLLGLEGVGNPDNVGGLFRVAAAFGAGGVVLDRTSGDPLYRKAIRTSMGSALSIPFASLESWEAAMPAIRERGFTIAALTPSPGAVPIGEFARSRAGGGRLLLLAGSEGAGLRGGTLAAADVQVRIPVDPMVDSLNVVVAVGVALGVRSCFLQDGPPADRLARNKI